MNKHALLRRSVLLLLLAGLASLLPAQVRATTSTSAATTPAPQLAVAPGIDVYASPNAGIQARLVHEIGLCHHTLEISMYNIANPVLAAAIKSAKDHGVAVRIVGDANQAASSSSLVPDLQHYGIPVRLLVPTPYAMHSMHQKFAIFDHHTVVLGSCNWSTGAMVSNYENAVFLTLTGVESALLSQFNGLWALTAHSFAAPAPGNTPHLGASPGIDLYFSPSGGERTRLLYAIGHCAHTLDIAMDLIQDATVASALTAAKGRGVAVRIITDNGESTKAASKVHALGAGGIPVLILGSGLSVIMHHKFAIFDHSTVYTGSYNASTTAETGNYEDGIWFDHNPAVAGAYQTIFNAMWLHH